MKLVHFLSLCHRWRGVQRLPIGPSDSSLLLAVACAAMPRVVGNSDEGIADPVVELQGAMQAMEARLRVVEARLRALELADEATARRPQERGAGVHARDGYRVCRNSCGREFRVHPNYPDEQHCCGKCRKGKGHSDHCTGRSRPLCGAAATD